MSRRKGEDVGAHAVELFVGDFNERAAAFEKTLAERNRKQRRNLGRVTLSDRS